MPDISSTYNVVLQDNQEQANNGTGVCSNGSPAGHLCITVNKKTDATGYLINPGESISFNFTLTTGPNALLSTWEVKANGTDSPNQGGNVFALSNTGTPTTSQVPEPAGLALLGSGLLGFGGYFRSKFPL